MLNNTTEIQLESPHCGKSFGTNKLPSTTNKSPSYIKKKCRGFPGGAVVESLPAHAGDTGSSPGLGRSHMPQRS